MHSMSERWTDPATRIYTQRSLRLYDTLVMGVFADRVWDCPAANFLAHYRQHLTSNHAEIGVGTGYCLDHCRFPAPNPRLALIDLQPNCLAYSARRLARYQPQTYVHDAREPMRLGIERFDSIALCGVLHCLPGGMGEKARVFDALEPIVAPGATIFGYTLVSDRVHDRALCRWVHRGLNRLRIIDNTEDRSSDLHAELSRRFVSPRVESIGCIAFFSVVAASRNTDAQGGRRHA